MSQHESQHSQSVAAWWLILCLVGLDYFSTLAYLPSMAIQAVGAAAPVASFIVAFVTLGIAFPVYYYVVARSPNGTGATGLLERLMPGWRGKILILFLLSFIATDYVVTQNLSIADAAEHLRANPHFQGFAQPLLTRHFRPETWLDYPWWPRIAVRLNTQLLLTMTLMCGSFAVWAFWRSTSPRRFLRTAAVVVFVYMALNGIVIVSGIIDLTGDGLGLLKRWQNSVLWELGAANGEAWGSWQWMSLIWLGLVSFPFVALGLSGFELSMAVAPMVHGSATDPPEKPIRRIRNTRKLLFAATVLMAIWLIGAVFVATIFIPHAALQEHGPAVHRALAYLAHGGALADGRPASALNPLFGAVFGDLYDLFTITILCMAGACVIIALREYVPDYLQRLGMELELAHRLGVKMRFFNVIVMVVGVWFGADILRMQWAYVTSVLTLLAGASLAALISVRREGQWLWLKLPLALFAVTYFSGMALYCAGIRSSGLEIAIAFAVGITLTSAWSRWLRSTELRWSGCDFQDEESRQGWERCCDYEFQILIPHRPGVHSRSEKVQSMRQRHRLDPKTPVILIEAELYDPSEFYHRPLMQVIREDGIDVIRVTRCASVSHVLAAIALEMSRVGRPVELHCGWSNESPLAANLSFLLFGEGNIPWMVRELIRKAEPDPSHHPLIIVG